MVSFYILDSLVVFWTGVQRYFMTLNLSHNHLDLELLSFCVLGSLVGCEQAYGDAS